MRKGTMMARGIRILAALGLGTMVLPSAALFGTATFPAPAIAQDTSRDSLILKSGKTVEGQILEETPTQVKMKVVVAGISGETTFQKSDILSIVRATAPGAEAGGEPAPKAGVAPEKPPASAPAGVGKKKVYLIELTGWFGEDISQTPLRNAVKDAKTLGVDYIIVSIDNDWSLRRFGQLEDLKDDATAFDQLFRAEEIEPIFRDEIPAWEKPPEVIFWVKKAMGGAAFLPMLCRTIYFSTEGKMGGIGSLSSMFGSMGDEVVREKQFSLRMKHAEGKAILGGYDPRIVVAMARNEYVLSLKFEGGQPVLLERMPESPDEILLTDDGEGPNQDDIEALARGEGNDFLTLTSDLAYKLGVSKGTADTLDDLLFQLGISRSAEVVKGQSGNLMKAWRDGIEEAKRQLPKLWQQVDEVEVKQPGGYKERTEARGRRRSLLNQMQQILRRYEEALNPRQIRVPNINQIDEIKKQLELEQLGDKPDRR